MALPLTIERHHDYHVGRFQAMAGPCEILLDSRDVHLARELAQIAQQETLRIEYKYSRYRDDNIIHTINTANGKPIDVDEETASLLDYAQQCFELSNGLFDITSGVLRRVWRFDGSDNVPEQQQIDALLTKVGWQKIIWQRPTVTLQPGMEIDLGGIGKEYAVDRVSALLKARASISCLVNFGGDIAVTIPRANGKSWVVGVADPDHSSSPAKPVPRLHLAQGAIATSGDATRYLIKDGVRYSHIINPKTGWPVSGGPRSVTVAADTCTEAGILSTLALLQGPDAETFLQTENVRYWCTW
ncbi:MAG: FAD:protein FMN transferase [Gammaproteobacteria bacterium]|jgi:thiamine biosynthesis lipoprotein